jgi:hypothetical protein
MVFKAPKPANPMDALAYTIVEFVPFYGIDPPTDPLDQLMRFDIMLTVNIPRLASKGPLKFDVAAEAHGDFDECFERAHEGFWNEGRRRFPRKDDARLVPISRLLVINALRMRRALITENSRLYGVFA